METKKVTYMYLYVGQGRVSIAIRYTPKRLKYQDAEMAVAFCAPTDQFCRKTGRNLATERLDIVTGPGARFVLPLKAHEHIKEVAARRLRGLLLKGFGPRWAHDKYNTGPEPCSGCDCCWVFDGPFE